MKDLNLTTPVHFQWNLPKFTPETILVSQGSCFSERITDELFAAGFKGSANPNGILYNPFSIYESIRRIVSMESYAEDEFFQFNGKWHSWAHHGSFSDPDRSELCRKCNESMEIFRKNAEQADLFLVTLSSAVVYELKETKQITANCHKVPNHQFNCRLLSLPETLDAVNGIAQQACLLSPRATILFTLSPVRHYPGDLLLNARSKAMLLTALHECCDQQERVCYFPAYEIIMDELRDYRFYKEDMLHPSPLATEIVVSRFMEQCFDNDSHVLLRESRKRLKAAGHIAKGG